MCKETLYDALDDIEYLRIAIAFLNEEVKKDKIEDEKSIIDYGVDKILTTEKAYVNKLQQDDNLKKKFRYSIVYGHIKWILSDMNNNYTKNFDNFNKSEIPSLSRAYRDIYTYLGKEYISTIKIHSNVKIILKDYFNSLAEIY